MLKYPKKDFYKKMISAADNLEKIKKMLKEFNPSTDSLLNTALRDSIIYNFNKFEEFILDSCETFLVENSLYELDSYYGKDLIRLTVDHIDSLGEYRNILLDLVGLRNKETHLYYVTEYQELVINFCEENIESLIIVFNALKDSFLDELAKREFSSRMSDKLRVFSKS